MAIGRPKGTRGEPGIRFSPKNGKMFVNRNLFEILMYGEGLEHHENVFVNMKLDKKTLVMTMTFEEYKGQEKGPGKFILYTSKSKTTGTLILDCYVARFLMANFLYERYTVNTFTEYLEIKEGEKLETNFKHYHMKRIGRRTLQFCMVKMKEEKRRTKHDKNCNGDKGFPCICDILNDRDLKRSKYV